MTDLPAPAPGCDACAARDAAIAELREQVGDLRATVARLERLASRNSGNSSMPPSADDVPGRTPPSRQQRRGGAGSAQARRAARLAGSAMCWAEPDEVIDYHPQGLCGCGADLGSALDLGVARSHQQLEIPEPPAPAHHLVQIGL